MSSTLVVQARPLNPKTLAFWGSAFLVAIPVFFQAPLVRAFPVISLGMTALLLLLSYWLRFRPKTRLAGSLLFGLTLSWWCGSLYWGWLRTDPLWHIPVEALGLPLAWIACRHFKIGSFFYLGSFFGTALTDVYIWSTGLTGLWVSMMKDESPQNLNSVLSGAMALMGTIQGGVWALGISALLLGAGLWAIRSRRIHWWAFGGAVLNTLAVNALFLASVVFITR